MRHSSTEYLYELQAWKTDGWSHIGYITCSSCGPIPQRGEDWDQDKRPIRLTTRLLDNEEALAVPEEAIEGLLLECAMIGASTCPVPARLNQGKTCFEVQERNSEQSCWNHVCYTDNPLQDTELVRSVKRVWDGEILVRRAGNEEDQVSLTSQCILELQTLGGENKWNHVGYVNHVFRTRQQAVDTLQDQYPSLEFSGLATDWTGRDSLRYLIVPYIGQHLRASTRDKIALDSLSRMNAQVGMAYILEAQSYSWGRGFCHVGYVDWLFDNKKLAGDFYHRMYPDHRDINRDGLWVSDWSVQDELRYIVRPYSDELTCLKSVREIYSGQRERIERMNKAIRQENSKP